ncbi:MAG: ribosome silencing factor [Deltaproteobacteria bacterium]|nr:ribosome silencing factor [Deltaproteobacteria bacterium]
MPRPLTAKTRAQKIAQAAAAIKAEGVTILDLRRLASFSDFFVICHGTSDRQVQAIADAVRERMDALGVRALGVEGYDQAHWILLDYGDVVAHVFYPAAREFYQIEKLWGDAPKIAVAA